MIISFAVCPVVLLNKYDCDSMNKYHLILVGFFFHHLIVKIQHCNKIPFSLENLFGNFHIK